MPFIGKQSTSNSQITNYTTTVGSGGQTNFTVVIEGGDETHVYLNGVLLKETTDYTVSSTQVSLVSPAVENDIVEIKVFRSFALVDAVRASEGGTFSGNVSFGDNNITNVGDIAVDTISSDAGTSIGVTLGTDSGDDFNVGSGKLVVKGDTGRVGVGTASPATQLEIEGSAPIITLDSSSSDPGVQFARSGTVGYQMKLNSSDNVYFYNNNTKLTLDSSGNLTAHAGNIVIGTAGKGIDFSVNDHASKMDSEILDDYETGELDHPVSFGGQSQGSSNFYSQNSDYTKVGNKVYVNIDFDTYNNTLAAAGPVSLNLPFASNQQIVLYVQAYMNSWSQWVLEVPRTSSTATFYTNSYTAFSLATNQRSIANVFLVYTTG